MFNRLKDFRRIATRYDKLARNFASAIALAAIALWWANGVWSLEAQVLAGLGNQLMQPDLVDAFIQSFNTEWARLSAEIAAEADTRRREVAALSRKIDHLVEVISDGNRSPSLRSKLAELEARRGRIAAAAAVPAARPTALHPGVAGTTVPRSPISSRRWPTRTTMRRWKLPGP